MMFWIGLFLGCAAAMSLGWAIAVRSGNNGWVDAVWTFTVGLLGLAALALDAAATELTARMTLVGAMVGLWSLRLGSHIVVRTARGKDDPRYARLKEEWGAAWRGRLFWFLQIQTVVAFLLVVAVVFASRRPGSLDLADAAGIAVFLVALFGEATADRQLAAFRSRPHARGAVCDLGLWGRSRHPNYFFEWLIWVAYLPVATGFSLGHPAGLVALVAPVMMYVLLVHVSGIPPLEAHMMRSRGEAFAAYARRVNAFWPGPRRAPG